MKKRITIIVTLSLIGIAAGILLTARHHRGIKHIVLISMDTTRADHLSCYGYPENTTPNIDALAEQATRFENTISPAPTTLPAHCSMLTGTTPLFHGVRNNGIYKLESANSTLAEILPNEFTSAAVISSFVLDRQFGLAQGFDIYHDQFQENRSDRFGNERRGDESTYFAMQWMERNKENKTFLFLHYYDPHEYYLPPEPYATEFASDPYAGEIAFVDHCIGRLIQKLKDLDLYDSTLLIITGDHGEMLGEHGEETHSYFIYQSAIHVPLIIKLPSQKKGTVITQPVGLIDIVPTICSLLKIDPPAGIQGRDLAPMLCGEIPEDYDRYLYSESVIPTRLGASPLMSITHGKWKYIQAPRPEFYDLEVDPGEENNLIDSEHQRARILEDKLQETLEQVVRSATDNHIELDSESTRRLQSLGYIAGNSKAAIISDETKPDPKDLIHLHVQLQKALSLKDEKKYNAAERILIDLLPQHPDFCEIYAQLAEMELRQGKLDAAIRYFRRAYDIDPRSHGDALLNDLAWIQATKPSLIARDVDEAVRYAKKSCERMGFENPAALDTLAVCYAAIGDFQKAVETARIATQAARSANQKRLAEDIAERLKLFEQSKPFIEE